MTTLGVLTKWVGVPVALLLAGRFVIGPMLLPKMPDSIRRPADDFIAEVQGKSNALKPSQAATQKEPAPTPVQVPVEDRVAPNESSTPVKDTSNSSASAADQSGGPEVEVSVHTDHPSIAHRIHRAHHKSTHSPAKKPKTTPQTDNNDPGSFGGTQDPPTTTGGGTTDPPTGN